MELRHLRNEDLRYIRNRLRKLRSLMERKRHTGNFDIDIPLVDEIIIHLKGAKLNRTFNKLGLSDLTVISYLIGDDRKAPRGFHHRLGGERIRSKNETLTIGVSNDK